MQRIALLVVLVGIIILASNIYLSTPIELKNKSEMSNLLENQKVHLSGKVTKETQTTYSRNLILDNNITLICECNLIPKLLNKQIEILGIIDTYQNNKIKVLKIRWE